MIILLAVRADRLHDVIVMQSDTRHLSAWMTLAVRHRLPIYVHQSAAHVYEVLIDGPDAPPFLVYTMP